MAKKFLTAIDLAKNELLNTVIQNLSSSPSSPVNGQVYYDTTLGQFGVRQAGVWVYLGASVVNAVTQASNSGGTNRLKVSAGADRTVQDFVSAGGIIKVAADGTVSLAVAGTDYLTGSSTNALTNKTFDANATGNTLSNVETADFATNVVDTDVLLGANSDTRLATQKATKTYIDNAIQGLKWKASARVATTVLGVLATGFANGSVVDGVTLATNDRILIKDQAVQTENGLYLVNATGAPTRTTDADTGVEISQMAIFIQEGTANSDIAFVCTNNGAITVNTTSLTFVAFTGNTVSFANSTEAEAKSVTNKAVPPSALTNFPVKKIATIGDGVATSIVVTHNLNTKEVVSQVRQASDDAYVECDIANTSVNTTTFTFSVAPASSSLKVVLIG